VSDVAFRTREEVVDAKNVVSALHQPIAKVRAEETRAAGD
jgi:hypothetical protein